MNWDLRGDRGNLDPTPQTGKPFAKVPPRRGYPFAFNLHEINSAGKELIWQTIITDCEAFCKSSSELGFKQSY